MEIKSFGSICSGVGMQEMAIKRVFPNVEIKYFAEIDKYAIASYKAIHGDIRNLGDFTQATDIPYVDFMFASTPCQDFSVAGKQAGFEGMRGTLTFEWVKMLSKLKSENKLPRIIGFENVPVISSERYSEGFDFFKTQLKDLGYNLCTNILDAKDYNLPQHRKRFFMIGFLGKKDFEFPKKVPLLLKVRDLLEVINDEKFYLTDKQVEHIKNSSYCQNTRRIQRKDWCDTLCARDYKDPKCIVTSKNRVRKLVPKEYWRLMGIKDNDFEKVKELHSNSQLYKQAGNGIAVAVLEYIFKEIKKCEKTKVTFDITDGQKQYKMFEVK